MSRFLSRSSRLIETFETNRDKSRFFEIFVGNLRVGVSIGLDCRDPHAYNEVINVLDSGNIESNFTEM